MLKDRNFCVILLQLNRLNPRERSKKGSGRAAPGQRERLFFRHRPQKIHYIALTGCNCRKAQVYSFPGFFLT
ncbi:hypothetical protein [Klebsiella pneumoniae ISC21]|nr:hypothetical protein [Klebsiella pneumoniae ISC21]